jgi:calcium-dependent protein kinase
MFSRTKKEELAKVFKQLDVNGDGKLSADEVKNGLNNHFGIQILDNEVQNLFKNVDTDQSGYIDYTEFIVACADREEFESSEFL